MKFAISVAIVLGSLGTTAEGQSLWRHADPSLSNLVADTAARHVGDLVTILIRETTDVANRDQRQLGKATDASFNFDFNAAGDLGSGAGAFDISKASDRNFDGNSQFSVEQDFTDQITAQVIDVLPNGNLVLGARRQRLVAGEMRTLVVSGIVRVVDVSPHNTVRSHHVAQFKICYEGDGPESSFTNQGWAGRLVNRIWPF